MPFSTEIGKDLHRAADLLRSGEIVAIPTETVYGLAGNGLKNEAVLKIFDAKNRPFFDPLILHIGDIDQLDELVESVPDSCKKLITQFWPGPLTVILPKKSIVPDLITAGSEYVAVRMPNHPLTLELLRTLPFPLAAPSANPFKYVSPTSAQHVFDQLSGKIPYILDGGSCQIGIESTIVSFFGDDIKIQRLGGIPNDEIKKHIPNAILATKPEEHPVAPGQLKHHYAPGCQLFPINEIEHKINDLNNIKIGIVLFDERNLAEIKHNLVGLGVDLNLVQWFILSFENVTVSNKFSQECKNFDNAQLVLATKNLFSTLRKLDQNGLTLAFFEWAPSEGLGLAINDRLKKAQYLPK